MLAKTIARFVGDRHARDAEPRTFRTRLKQPGFIDGSSASCVIRMGGIDPNRCNCAIAGNNWLVKRSLAMEASTTSIEWLEAVPVPCCRWARPERYTQRFRGMPFPHSSTAWLSQMLPLRVLVSDGGMVHLQEPIFNTLGSGNCSKLLQHHALLRHCSRKQSGCSNGKESQAHLAHRATKTPCGSSGTSFRENSAVGRHVSLAVLARQPACGPFSRYGLGTIPRACTLRV